MNAVPLIRIELEGMKHAIIHAMSEHLAQMDADIQEAVNAACTPENIKKIITDTAEREIKNAITQHVQDFYRYGDGRSVIRDAVFEVLKDGV